MNYVMDTLDKINLVYEKVAEKTIMCKSLPGTSGFGKLCEKIPLQKPVKLGDVYDWIFSQENITQKEGYMYANMILEVREELRKPIEDQTDECIDFIYSLVK